jgi:hypothetical protein
MDSRMFDPVSGQVFSPPRTDVPRVREPFAAAPYQPTDSPIDDYVSFSGPVSIGDVHDINDDPTRPASTADLGDLFPTIDQGIESIDGIGEGPSGIIPSLAPPHDDYLPVAIELPPTSAINEKVPPWHNPPKPRTTPTSQRG